MFMYVGNNVLV